MRRRYVQIEGELHEMATAVSTPREARFYVVGDRHYHDLRAPDRDRTPIDSRVKHREYMKRHDLSTMDDWTETWKKAARERQQDVSRKRDLAATFLLSKLKSNRQGEL